jgi:hypothetical protein
MPLNFFHKSIDKAIKHVSSDISSQKKFQSNMDKAIGILAEHKKRIENLDNKELAAFNHLINSARDFVNDLNSAHEKAIYVKGSLAERERQDLIRIMQALKQKSQSLIQDAKRVSDLCYKERKEAR